MTGNSSILDILSDLYTFQNGVQVFTLCNFGLEITQYFTYFCINQSNVKWVICTRHLFIFQNFKGAMYMLVNLSRVSRDLDD